MGLIDCNRVTTGCDMKTFSKKCSLAMVAMALLLLAVSSPALAADGLDRELEEYWTTERDLEVIRGRLFEREGRFSAGLYTGLLSSDPFFYYFPVGVRGGYHFSNALSLEAGGSFMDAGLLTHDTELTDFLRRRLQDAFDATTDTDDRYLWRANAVAIWSPFYGKLALLQRKLAHFDLNVATGLGVVGMERPDADRRSASNHVTVEMVLGAGAHIYVNQNVTIRLDGRGYLYRGAEYVDYNETFTQQLKFPVEFLLGASYLF